MASFRWLYSVVPSRKIKCKHKADGLQAVCLLFVLYLDEKGHGIKLAENLPIGLLAMRNFCGLAVAAHSGQTGRDRALRRRCEEVSEFPLSIVDGSI